MIENRFKEIDLAPEEQPVKEKRKHGFNANMSASFLIKHIYFIFYIAFLGIIYIANSHYAVGTIKEIKNTQKELKTLSYECNSKKSDLMFQSMESIIAEKVIHLGLEEIETTPKKIVDKTRENN